MNPTMTTVDTTIHAFRTVKMHRTRSADYFPLPTPAQCMRYAIQELAELDDAWMRQENPAHKRNNGREHDAELELGQAGYMIASSLLDCFSDVEIARLAYTGTRTSRWAYLVAKCADSLTVPGYDLFAPFAHDALYLWVRLVSDEGIDPLALLSDVAQRIDQKWGQKVTA